MATHKQPRNTIRKSPIILGVVLLLLLSGTTTYALVRYLYPQASTSQPKIIIPVSKTVIPTPAPSAPAPAPPKQTAPVAASTPPPVAPVTTTTTTTTTVTTPTPTAPAPAPVAPAPTTPSSDLSSSPSTTSTVATVPSGGAYYSTNWSGYMATNASFTGISGAWTVPTPTSTSTTADSSDAAWIGIGGITTSDLIQAGTYDTVSPAGVVTINAFYELLPAAATAIVTMTVSPGDQLTASITQTTAGNWTITLTDLTTAQTYTKAVAYTSSLSSAEWIEEVPTYSGGKLATLDNFGTIQFTGGSTIMNGTSTTLAGTNPSSATMVNNSKPIAIPGGLSGGAFHVTYQP